jgi:NAD(P)-dependent dehydrogenase (short-subunit alcohol dehydrogenase family)
MNQDMNHVSNSKTMLITGGSRGIGAATAKLAASHGFQVVINYASNAAAAEAVVNDIGARGGRAMAFQADVTDSDAVTAMFKAVDQAFGGLDVLVNNAGILETFSILDADPDRVQRTFEANLFSLYYCSREAVRRMSTDLGGHGGVIINMSSAAARLCSMPGGNAYSASKAAVDGFNLSLANEVGAQGIRVNAIRPGLIATDIQNGRGGIEVAAEIAKTAVPLKRIGQPEEVAQAVIWLASPAASYVHGSVLDVGGGR